MKAEHRLPVYRVRLLALVAQADAGGAVRRSQIVRAIAPIGGALALALLTDPPWESDAIATGPGEDAAVAQACVRRDAGRSPGPVSRAFAVDACSRTTRKKRAKKLLGPRA